MAASLIVGFNEAFFMSLMFLLSGLFAWQSIQRRGAAAFIRTRALRLGLPFAAGSLLLAPLAYYPAYLQTTARATSPGFWDQWTSLGIWYSGPVWFLWVLLAFDCAAAGFITRAPRVADAWKSFWARTSGNSFRFFATLSICSLAVYLPMAVTFSSMSWWAYGPFTVQTSRIFHYALYFLVGVALGGAGLERSVLRDGGPLSRRWIVWPMAALVAFAIAAAITMLQSLPRRRRRTGKRSDRSASCCRVRRLRARCWHCSSASFGGPLRRATAFATTRTASICFTTRSSAGCSTRSCRRPSARCPRRQLSPQPRWA
jgi:hypothetical protein